MRKCLIFYVLSSLLLISAMSSCGKPSVNQVDLSDSLAAAKDTVKWRSLPVEEVIPIPLDILLSDSNIVCLGMVGDNWLHVYDKESGSSVSSFMRLGQGPGEMANAVGMDKLSDTLISIYDMGMGRLDICGLDPCGLVKSVPIAENVGIVWQAWSLSDSAALVKFPVRTDGGQPLRAFGILNLATKEMVATYEELPDEFKSSPMTLMVQTSAAFSPDKKHFASVTMLGGAMEFFEIGDRSITPVYSKTIFAMKFAEKGGVQQIDGKPTYGFISVCATNDKVFTSYSGTTNPDDATKIAIWDWEGNLIECFPTDRLILKLAVDPANGDIYGAVMGEEGPMLARLDLD